jgi:transposase-like protein
MAKRGEGCRRYPIGFKQQAVGRMKAGTNVSELARELGIGRSLLYIWSRKIEGRTYGNEPCGPPDLRDQRIQDRNAVANNGLIVQALPSKLHSRPR